MVPPSDIVKPSPRRRVLYLVLAAGLAAGSASGASSASKSAMFGFSCANTKTALPPAVKQVVSEIIAKSGDDRAGIYGDRNVNLRLRRSSEVTWFVPLFCDGWGNCKWAIVGQSPARSLGVMVGMLFMMTTGGSDWPEITILSTTRTGEAAPPQGASETLEFKGDGYRRKKISTVAPGLVGTLSSCLEDKSCCPSAP